MESGGMEQAGPKEHEKKHKKESFHNRSDKLSLLNSGMNKNPEIRHK